MRLNFIGELWYQLLRIVFGEQSMLNMLSYIACAMEWHAFYILAQQFPQCQSGHHRLIRFRLNHQRRITNTVRGPENWKWQIWTEFSSNILLKKPSLPHPQLSSDIPKNWNQTFRGVCVVGLHCIISTRSHRVSNCISFGERARVNCL